MSTPREILDQAVTAWNAKDEARLLAIASQDIDLPSPGGLTFRGLDGFHQWYQLWMEGFPNRLLRVHNIVSATDQLIYEGTFTGTHTGVLHLPTGDVPPTGRRINVDYVGVLRISNGRMSYLRHYLDVMDLMAQLGLVGVEAKA
jgi:predicted ester cyclase